MMKQRIIEMMLACLLVSLIPGVKPSLHAQGISARMYFDSAQIMIGEQIRFHLQVSLPPDARVSIPVFSDTIAGKIEILQSFPADSSIRDNESLMIQHTYLVSSFEPGIWEVQPLSIPVEFYGQQDTLSTSFASLTVISPEIDQEKGIYDIKPVMAVPVTLMEIIPWLLLLIAFLVGIYFLFRYLRMKRKNQELAEIILKEEAHVIALRDLENLKASKLWQQGKHKEYHSRLTDVLRKYLEHRYAMKAMESTSSEILAMLDQKSSLQKHSRGLAEEILTAADLVKFAKVIPEEATNERNLDYAVLFVLDTKYERQPDIDHHSDKTNSLTT
jgi:hypothetical protein